MHGSVRGLAPGLINPAPPYSMSTRLATEAGVAGFMNSRPMISACLIVKDEERFIEECLRRLRAAVDEIVVVDTGSTDATVSIAEGLGARVFHHPWRDDFAEARNVALSYATHPWIFVIDADEYLNLSTIEHLSELDARGADGYLIDVVNFPDDDDNRVISKHLALVKNDRRFRFEGAIHENLANSIVRHGGTIDYLPIQVDHLGYSPEVVKAKGKRERNLSILRRELKRVPDNPWLNYYLAQEYFAQGQLEDAIKYYRRALWRVAPRGGRFVPTAAVRLMIALWRLSRLEEAYEVLERYQAEYVEYTDLHFLDGVFSRKLGNYHRAEGALLRALALGDASTAKFEQVHVGFGTYRAWTELGELYEELGKFPEAFSALTEALKANPRYSPAIARLSRLALRHDEPQDVLRYLSRVADLQSHPCAVEAWEAFFSARAWRECEALAEGFPDDKREFYTMLVRIRQGAWDAVIPTLLEFADTDHYRTAAIVNGILLAADRTDVELGKRFLRLADNERSAMHSTLADLVTVMSQPHPGATAIWSDAASLESKIESAWQLVARAVALGLTTALEHIGVLLAWYIDDPGTRALRFGKILEQLGYADLATEQYLLAGLEGKYDAGSLLTIVKQALRTGQSSEAVVLLEEIVKLTPSWVLPRVLLARTLRESGEIDRAQEVLEQGRASNPYAYLLETEMSALDHYIAKR